MCKHVAAVLYGIGARLDEDPALFFSLRQVNMDDLIARAVKDTTRKYIRKAQKSDHPVVAEADLGSVFGIDMDDMPDFGKPVAEAVPKSARGSKPSPEAAPARRSTTQKAHDDKTLILELLERTENGIDASGLHAESGIPVVKIRNILFQAYHKGLILKVARGIYKARTPEPTRATGVDRRQAVLAVIEASPRGVRTPKVAEKTGMSPAAVRPVMARLLAAGSIRRLSRGVYGPPAKRRRRKSANHTGAVLAMIQSHPEGIAVSALKAQSGVEEKQLRNIVFRLFNSGKIRRIGRGIYRAAPGESK
jgi:predicted transcriptional regulator of viral defense system